MEKLTLEMLAGPPIARRRMEVVERKGLGHPDTLCDSVVETIAVALGRMYLEQLGAIAHYNVDKALLAAGECAKGFGWGTLTRPMELIVGDRACFEVGGRKLPVESTVRTAVDEWTAHRLPRVRPGRDLCTRLVLAPGSEELQRIFNDGHDEALSNDTCATCGYAPLTPTEETVLAVERFLNSAEFKRAFPDTGEDVKVFGVREDERLALTIAMPFLCLATASETRYFRRKDEVLAALAARFSSAPFVATTWTLNALDRRGRGTAGTYLTLTGTSAEDADSGQVGRGNRVNGLISVGRPAGGEAAAGKNPVAHIGKIYSVLSDRLARLIHQRCPDIVEVYVTLAARIGEPVDRPWTSVQVLLPQGLALAELARPIEEAIDAEIARLPELRAELLRGAHGVC